MQSFKHPDAEAAFNGTISGSKGTKRQIKGGKGFKYQEMNWCRADLFEVKC